MYVYTYTRGSMWGHTLSWWQRDTKWEPWKARKSGAFSHSLDGQAMGRCIYVYAL